MSGLFPRMDLGQVRIIFLLASTLSPHLLKDIQSPPIELVRHYVVGERVAYRMTGIDEDRTSKSRYSGRADGIVIQLPGGSLAEKIGWSEVIWNQKPVELSTQSLEFRQQASLDPKAPFVFPDLRHVASDLIGPITDLQTFYVDLLLPIRAGALKRQGDHFVVHYGKPASWANGMRVKIGEDAIDFDVTLRRVDSRRKRAEIVVLHVPPAKPEINLPTDWMREPVKDTPNNWVQVSAGEGGKTKAAVGKETFDVSIIVDLTTGRLLSAVEENVVDVRERECSDASLANPGPPITYRIHRRIEIRAIKGAAG